MPFSFFLGKDERASLITEFTVDCDAAVGDSSDIVVTATSSLDFTQNSAFAVISVISDVIIMSICFPRIAKNIILFVGRGPNSTQL